ncbi:MAG: dihydropteroate synthase [Beijerinckiaceae bacterium]
MLDKYFYALGRGVRGIRAALEEQRRAATPDPARDARDITPVDRQHGKGSAPERLDTALDSASRETALPRDALVLGARPLIMGILNATPDSFSDGGQFADAADAIAFGLRLVEHGADVLDIGGESTRPGATPVDVEEELARTIPVVRGLAARTRVPLSIDTMKAKVAANAIEAGATIVNDVWGFQFDADMARTVADAGVHCVLMHNRAQDDPGVDMFAEVRDFLFRSVDLALAAGVQRDKIILDPGIGFGKTNAQSLEMVCRLGELKAHFGLPVLLGLSRKRIVGQATGKAAGTARDAGTLAANLFGVEQGADILRVHNPAVHADGLKMLAALESAGPASGSTVRSE